MKYNSLLENWNKFLENNEKSVVLINEQTLTPTQFAANITNVAKSPVSKVGAEQETKKVVSDPNSTKELGQLIKSNNFFGAIKYLAQLLKGDDTIELAKVVNLLYPASKQPLKGQVSEQVNPITFASSAAQRALVNLGNGDMETGLNKFTGYSAFIVVVGMIMTNLMVAWQNKDTSSARDALELIPHLKNSLSLSKSGDLLKFFTDTSSSITEAKKKKAGDRCTRIAKRKYDVWPSAYASGAVVKCRQGKIWKGISENATDEDIDLELLLEEVEVIDEEWSEKYKRSIDCNNPKGFSQKAHCQGRKKKESIVRNNDIIEERSRSTNVSVLKQLQPYSKNPSYYVTFTDLEKVGVNPNNKFATPLGVYAYNLKDLWNDWISGDRFFGDDRKYVNLLKLNTDKIFDFQNYKNYKKDYQYLQNIYEKDYQSTTKMPFDDYVKSLEEKATLYEHSSEAAQIWDIIQSMFQINDKQANVGMATKRSTILWTKALRDMGYEAVIDRGSNIHLLQSSQAIFLSPQSYDIVDRFVNRTYKQTVENEDKWGSSKQPFWRPGVNPTIDNVIFKNDNGLKVLLIKRSATSKAEANKYAFPGGFHDTNQPKGQPWKNDRESAIQAAFRELAEETGLWIPTLNNIMKLVGSYEGNKRDPRDNQEAWSKTTAFAVLLPEEYNDRIVSGRDDAQEAIWVPVEQAQKMDLAFDHNQILNDALSTLNLNESNYQNLWLQFLEEAKKKRPYKPNFSKEKEQGLHGWFARNKGKGWINCRTGGPCGRSSADKKGGKYPACRPTKAQCKSAGKGPLRKKKSSKPISWVKKKKKD